MGPKLSRLWSFSLQRNTQGPIYPFLIMFQQNQKSLFKWPRAYFQAVHLKAEGRLVPALWCICTFGLRHSGTYKGKESGCEAGWLSLHYPASVWNSKGSPYLQTQIWPNRHICQSWRIERISCSNGLLVSCMKVRCLNIWHIDSILALSPENVRGGPAVLMSIRVSTNIY
jgi:hypothetical protein